MSQMPGQQAEHLRRVAAAVPNGAPPAADRVAVVFGAKGGVGTSAVALSLARDLARSAKNPGVAVLAVDAHAGRTDLAVMAAEQDLPALALTTAAKLGIEPPAGQGASVTEAAKRLLRAARLWTDDSGGWIVVDAGVGDTLWARELASRAARPLLVTTPDRLSVINGYATLKRLGAVARRVGVIANHVADAEAAAETHAVLAQSCQQFLASQPTLAGWLPTRADDPTSAEIMSAAA